MTGPQKVKYFLGIFIDRKISAEIHSQVLLLLGQGALS